MLELKNYQRQTLDALRTYLEEARFKGPKPAYDAMDKEGVPNWRAYRPMEGLPDTPFVCLRLPTGGGKTLLAAHTVKIAAEAYLEREYPLVLWLVPTNTIRNQTLETLRKAGHPNHETLRAAFDGKLTVLDISDFSQLRPHDLKSRACIVVGTIQTLRVDSMDGRKVYAHNENLEPHFAELTVSTEGLERVESGDDAGQVRFSFSNLLALHRPLVIVDEAHNASTPLSNEVMRRIRARCIVEFTATPATDSNILHNVSASELKAEEMIKLPIRLKEHKSWEEAVHDSILTRERLAGLAKSDGEYIRPIVLYQAEKKDRDITKEVLLKHLTEQEKLPRDKIAVVTGDQKELDGINLFDPACPIEHVVTIEALKEGWDCSFAYVFCSVANVHSAKDVEQILGRVLRMPYAKRRTEEELNRAYAHVSQASWPNAVRQLHDRLVDMGFEEQEADRFIEWEPDLIGGTGDQPYPAAPAPLVLEVREEIGAFELPEAERDAVRIETTDAGSRLTITAPLSDQAAATVLIALNSADDRRNFTVEHKVFKAAWARSASPAQRGDTFRVPQLCVRQDGELALAEKELFLDATGWNLLDGARYSTELTESSFNLHDRGHEWEIYINEGKVKHRSIGSVNQMNLDLIDTGWNEAQLCRWLDQKLRQPDIRQPVLLEFVRRNIAHLTGSRKIALTALVRARWALSKVLLEKLRGYREQAFAHGYQETLFGPGAAVETTFDYGFRFGRDTYAPHWLYRGSYQFAKHFYSTVGELKPDGEEFDCARAIDLLPATRHWVRNLERREGSFWLPTSTDRFYPDFVAELTDGRVLVVEHKGADRASADDAKEKSSIGQLWEERSGGKALFLMTVVERGRPVIGQQIKDKIGH